MNKARLWKTFQLSDLDTLQPKKMKILVLDNYDSFTYNLVYIVRQLGYGTKMDVFRNDKISLEDIDQYDKIILSPGPGFHPKQGSCLNC